MREEWENAEGLSELCPTDLLRIQQNVFDEDFENAAKNEAYRQEAVSVALSTLDEIDQLLHLKKEKSDDSNSDSNSNEYVFLIC